jgi:cytochrome c oxidase cbb3-type subunit 3
VVYNQFPDKSVEALAKNEKAVKMGQRLFSTNCTVCHGADAGGGHGYPNLRDSDWLYGGSGEQIKTTITGGRQGAMPAWEPVIGEEKVQQAAAYVKALSEHRADDASVVPGKEVFGTYCAACHGANGDGNTMIGAPRLNDHVWLYGGDLPTIAQSIREGRQGKMPAHGELLSEERIQLLAAYVYSLSNK